TFDVPAGSTTITVQALSEKDASSTLDGLPASLAWLTAGLEIAAVEERLAALGDYVWHDLNMDGIQDAGEPGIERVTVNLYDCADNFLATMPTDANGLYLFSDLTPGDYYVEFILPGGYVFSPQDQGSDDAVDSDADMVTGKTVCTTLDAGETDLTWDAGMYDEPTDGQGCTPGYWKNHEEDWPATGYALDDDFDTVFGTDYFDPDMTLFEAVWHGGGGLWRLGRHGTAALLSAAHPDVDYGLTVAEVIEAVQNGDADTLEYYNELGCPLDRDEDIQFIE
ncbi:MAG: hypothetical protein KAT30_05100, partial [Candidatus Krumholzibacteria bacterium]|nr:hypothetical protein [Candidatus Krumholzibacteria bacterium]